MTIEFAFWLQLNDFSGELRIFILLFKLKVFAYMTIYGTGFEFQCKKIFSNSIKINITISLNMVEFFYPRGIFVLYKISYFISQKLQAVGLLDYLGFSQKLNFKISLLHFDILFFSDDTKNDYYSKR